jgi:hypothetical protein
MRVAHVAAIAELGNVFPSVLAGNVDVSALHRALEQRPVAFKAVYVVLIAHVLFL